MNMIKLGDIGEFINGYAFKSSQWKDKGWPIIRIQNLTNSKKPFNYCAPEDVQKRYYVKNGDILISWSASLDVFIWDGQDALLNQHIFKVELDEKRVDKDFFYFFMKGKIAELASRTHGSTMKHITKSKFLKTEFPDIDIKRQRNISKELRKVKHIFKDRKKSDEHIVKFLENAFVNLFENELENGDSFIKLSKLLDGIENGWSPVCQKEPASEGEYGVLKLSAVSYGVYNPNENKAMKEGTEPKLNCEVEKGDFLFTRKNTYELVGACAYVQETPPKMMLPDIIFRLKIKDENELNPIYLWGLFNNSFFREKIRKLASGSAGSMPNISKQRLLGLEIPVPSIEKQKKYAEIYLKIRELQNKNKLQEDEIVNLQHSLSSKYFN